MASEHERRRHKRVAVTWIAQAQAHEQQPFTVEIVNVSVNGLGVISLSPMSAGGRYFFKFSSWTEDPVEGVVRWSDIGPVQTYAGIEFFAPTHQQASALQKLIRRYDKEDWEG